jgi:hypothetical protein
MRPNFDVASKPPDMSGGQLNNAPRKTLKNILSSKSWPNKLY